MNLRSVTALPLHLALAVLCIACSNRIAHAQSLPDAPEVEPATATLVLPEDPSAALPAKLKQQPSAPAKPFDKYVEPGHAVAPLTPFDKFLLGTRHATTSFAVATWVFTASYGEALNSRPNYARSGKGYLQRLGAAAAHNTSSGLFSDSILAPALHLDPRYYKLGPAQSVGRRIAYAVTRPLITRTDGGATSINFAQLGGNLASAALTDAYYPQNNRSAGATLITFGTSMGGGALGYLFNEFFSLRLPWER